MASLVKAAPSRCGNARAIDKQANRQKTTFILLKTSTSDDINKCGERETVYLPFHVI